MPDLGVVEREQVAQVGGSEAGGSLTQREQRLAAAQVSVVLGEELELRMEEVVVVGVEVVDEEEPGLVPVSADQLDGLAGDFGGRDVSSALRLALVVALEALIEAQTTADEEMGDDRRGVVARLREELRQKDRLVRQRLVEIELAWEA